MSNVPVVYVAINLALLYLYLSVVASILQEWVAQFTALRSKTLRSGIGILLNDPDTVGIVHDLFHHGLIKGISANGSGPSYIPGSTFASVLLDLLAPNQPGDPPNVFASVHGDIAAIPANSPLVSVRNSLLALADNSGGDLAKLHDSVAQWFDSAMDRVSGEYKRYAQKVLFVIGLGLAVILNADTFGIARIVSTPPTSYATDQAIEQILQSRATRTNKEGGTSADDDQQRLIQTLTPVLPLGWCQESPPQKPGIAAAQARTCNFDFPPDWTGWPRKILGILITALMVSLGAPFWFDILGNIMNIRAAGPRPADAKKTGD